MSSIHIIGAGLSGLSAALALADSGHRICVHEAAAQAGGRCRSYHDMVLNRILDNGNHLILESNKETFALLETIGTRENWIALREGYTFIDLKHGSEWELKAPRWLPKTALIENFALLRLMHAGSQSTVSQFCASHRRLYQQFIEPICVSALNTKPQQASARAFGNLLKQLIKGGPRAAIPYVARRCLQQDLIEPLIETLKSKGVDIYYQQRLKVMEYEEGRVSNLRFTRGDTPVGEHDTVILAVPAYTATELLTDSAVPAEHEAIINGHFRLDHSRHNGEILGIAGSFAQWIFFRDGMVSTTTSAANEHLELTKEEIASLLWADICSALGVKDELPDYRIITEKRATFTATPQNEARRPQATTGYSNLFLAGDYTATGLPATMEGSITSGNKAASIALESI